MNISDGKQVDVWVYEWAGDTLSRLTFDLADDRRPVWTPDSRRIAIGSRRAADTTWNLYWQRTDGTGEIQRLTDSKNEQSPGSWHPSGKFLAFDEQNPQTSGRRDDPADGRRRSLRVAARHANGLPDALWST